MPPKPKRTRQEVLDSAVNIIRRDGARALTAKSLGTELGIAPSSIFTHFRSMEEVFKSSIDAIYSLYASYVERGMQMVPPFKGYGMELVHFATDEPNLFEALFLRRKTRQSLEDYIDTVGYEDDMIESISSTFGLDAIQSEEVFHHLWVYVCGIATLVATGACSFSLEEISEMLGTACRGFIISASSPSDARTRTIPSNEMQMEGSVDSYLLK